MKRSILIVMCMLLALNICNASSMAIAEIDDCAERESAPCSLDTSELRGYECECKGDILTTSFARRKYDIYEPINVYLELTQSITIEKICYESAGFTAVESSSTYDVTSGCTTYDFVLKYDGVCEQPYWKIIFEEESGQSVSAEIFGYLSAYGLFLSNCSFDAAMEGCYAYLVETGVLSEEAYNELMWATYSKTGTETVQIAIASQILDRTDASAEGLFSCTWQENVAQ